MPDRLPQAPPLPGDAICLHIGIHKTGTTALQSAFAAARGDLAAQGVLYPGRRTAHHGPAMSILGRPWGWAQRGGEVADPAVFDRLARQARRHSGRVLISSEQFCEADDQGAARVVAGLGADRTHVVIALRSLGQLLPSSWQQYLKYGQTMAYGKWLRTVLDPEYDGRVTPTFWRRNDHGALVARWAGLLGPDHVTVLIVDDVVPQAIFHTFAELLDIEPDVLLARREISTNRSMTAPESELLRRLNRAVGKELSWQDYETLVRGQVVEGMLSRAAPPEEPRLSTPAWALEVAAQRGATSVAEIRGAGVRVLGDLDALGRLVDSRPQVDVDPIDQLPMDAAVAVAVAQVRAGAGRSRPSRTRRAARDVRSRLSRALPRR